MTDLRLVAVTPERSHLVLEDSESNQFRVSIDARMATALRTHPLFKSSGPPSTGTKSAQLEIALESQLSPREIQARIRAGGGIDEVAAAAGISAERVERYATPVLAEREHVTEQARLAPARRASGGNAPRLGELVDARLAEQRWRADVGAPGTPGAVTTSAGPCISPTSRGPASASPSGRSTPAGGCSRRPTTRPAGWSTSRRASAARTRRPGCAGCPAFRRPPRTLRRPRPADEVYDVEADQKRAAEVAEWPRSRHRCARWPAAAAGRQCPPGTTSCSAPASATDPVKSFALRLTYQPALPRRSSVPRRRSCRRPSQAVEHPVRLAGPSGKGPSVEGIEVRTQMRARTGPDGPGPGLR